LTTENNDDINKKKRIESAGINFDIPTIMVRREGETEWEELYGEEKEEYMRNYRVYDEIEKRKKTLCHRFHVFKVRLNHNWMNLKYILFYKEFRFTYHEKNN
jgi:hypothetical protein